MKLPMFLQDLMGTVKEREIWLAVLKVLHGINYGLALNGLTATS